MEEANALCCESCGAPLDAPAGRSVVECAFCGHTQELEGLSRGEEADAAMTERLMRAYDNNVGKGARHGLSEMAQQGWWDLECGLWPVDAKASSNRSGGHGAESVIGPPTVYPLRGDRKGTWSPSDWTSNAEWIEAVYSAEAPRVSKVRVFETKYPGSTYAVTVRDRPDGPQELLWQAPPNPTEYSDSLVLEVSVDPPRRLHSVRAYVDNSYTSWIAIDTIGLVAAEPLPPEMRTKWRRRRKPLPWPLKVVAFVVLSAWGLGRWCDSMSEPAAQPSTHDDTVAGNAGPWPIDKKGLAEFGTVWATHARASSERGDDDFAAKHATGPPDVFPRYGDDSNTWASRGANDGKEWLDVSWDHPVSARALVVIETFHSGTLVEADDLSGPRPTRLWRGRLFEAPRARVVAINWAPRRRISRVRLVFDTKRVTGWTEIDAVGAVSK